MGQLPPGAVTLVETEADVDAFEPADPAALGFVTPDHPVGRRHRRRDSPAAIKVPRDHRAGGGIDLLRKPPTARRRSSRQRPGCDLFVVVGRARIPTYQFQAACPKSRSGPVRNSRSCCSAPTRSTGRPIGDIGLLGISAGAFGAGSRGQRDHRGVSRRALTRTIVNSPRPCRKPRISWSTANCGDVELTAADMAFVNGVE